MRSSQSAARAYCKASAVEPVHTARHPDYVGVLKMNNQLRQGNGLRDRGINPHTVH
ncbi:hypothetical protein BC830DRAFT_1149512 [Chytriomyces sp. MP71]|nr:hypothetical protein BC830DRAFT_1149512 [Chytriomyces sp. MP71]